MNYSDNFSGALDKAAGLAARTGGLICTEHLLYGLAALSLIHISEPTRP